MNVAQKEQHYQLEGETYTKAYDFKGGRYKFLLNGREIDIYQWNKAANRYHSLFRKATRRNLIVRLIEKQRWALTRRSIGPRESSFLVDTGCEGGDIASTLARRCRHLILLDVNEDMLSSLRAKMKDPTISCLVADIYNIPFLKGSVDRILCTEVLEHLIDPQNAVREIERVLKPGGRVVVSVPNDRFNLWIKKRLIRLGLGPALGIRNANLPMGHLHIFDKDSLKSLFSPNIRTVKLFYNFPWFTYIFCIVEKQ